MTPAKAVAAAIGARIGPTMGIFAVESSTCRRLLCQFHHLFHVEGFAGGFLRDQGEDPLLQNARERLLERADKAAPDAPDGRTNPCCKVAMRASWPAHPEAIEVAAWRAYCVRASRPVVRSR
jgi:hypothetical protein